MRAAPAGTNRPAAARACPVVVTGLSPLVDGGAFPVKCVTGDEVEVSAHVFTHGHDRVRAHLRSRAARRTRWTTVPMSPAGSDVFSTRHLAGPPGRYELEVVGELDPLATWRDDAARRAGAGLSDVNDASRGAELIAGVAGVLARGDPASAEQLDALARRLLAEGPAGIERALGALVELDDVLSTRPTAATAATRARLPLDVARPLAGCSSWYECFPRSTSPHPGYHGTLADMTRRLEYIASLGFDVVYLPPIHPIGSTARRGRANAPLAGADDPGSPWAIGSDEGGHLAVHPSLGTLEDFDALVVRAGELGLEIALDLAFQCSPDHPWVHEHPAWFAHRPDGTIACAENPPKRYEDIYPLDFTSPEAPALFEALLEVTLHWVGHGVRVFRVDNPHTKPFALWEWLIAEVKRVEPGVVFLAEAFTRPDPLERLAKLGFDQSYTYFAWRDTKEELTAYLDDLAHGPASRFLRPNLWPNTPDILARSLQHGGRPSFVVRLLLAACASANYGIYGPLFELCVDEPAAPESDEYAHSEKYELRRFDLDDPHSLAPLVALVNAARRGHPALRSNSSLVFHAVDNERLVCFSKYDRASDDAVLCVVNLDPDWAQSGYVELDLGAIGHSVGDVLELEDLLDGHRYRWSAARNYVLLEPSRDNAHLFVCRRAARR